MIYLNNIIYYICKQTFIMKKLTFLILMFLLGLNSQSVAQVDLGNKKSQTVVLKMEDGSVINGIMVDRTDTHVTVNTASAGDITIAIESIKDIDYIDDVRNILFDKNGYPVDFYNSTRYFINPTGYSLKKGQSYYENIYLFLNSYTYGITDNISVSGGAEIASILFGPQIPLLFGSVKFSKPFNNEKGAFGVNTTFLVLPESGLSSVALIAGSFTFGSRNNNFSVGTGVGGLVPLNIGFMTRLSEKVSLVSDNTILFFDGDQEVLASFGARIHFRKVGTALNLGLIRPLSGGIDILGIPYVAATIPIGK